MSLVASRSLPGAWPDLSGILLDESMDEKLPSVLHTGLAAPPNSLVNMVELATNPSMLATNGSLALCDEVRDGFEYKTSF